MRITEEQFNETRYTEADLLNYKDNAASIFTHMDDQQRKDFDAVFTEGTEENNFEDSFFTARHSEITIRFGTVLKIPNDFMVAVQPTFLEKAEVFPFRKFSSFVDEEIRAIIED